MAKNKYAVCLVDDDPSAVQAVQKATKSIGVELLTFPDARTFLADLEFARVGCMILEINLSGVSGLELQEILKATKKPIPLIFLTAHATIPLAVQAMKNGAQDVLEKTCEPTVIAERLKQGLALKTLWQKIDDERKVIAMYMAQLTPRERDVMELMAGGRKNKEIAQHLGISMKTLDIHRTKVMAKMNVRTWADLARWCLLQGCDMGGRVTLKPGGYL